MLARRSRLQVKPNISRSSKATPKPAENLDESVDVSSNAGIPAETLPVAETSADASVNDGSAVIDGAISEESPCTVTHTLARRPRLQVKPNITESSKAAPKFTEKLGESVKVPSIDGTSAEVPPATENASVDNNSVIPEDAVKEGSSCGTAQTLVRRFRLQVKPNISKNSKSGPKPAEKLDETANSKGGLSLEALLSAEDGAPSNDSAVTEKAIPESGELGETPATVSSSTATRTVSVEEAEIAYVDPLAPEKRIAHSYGSGIRARDRLTSYSDYYGPSTKSKLKKRFTGDEELDPKKMRMMDMIYWNPKKEKGMTRFHGDTESVVGEKLSSSPEKRVTTSESTKVAAPQVKIGADGRLVIDEESLVVEETATNESVWETVEEDRMLRKVTSLSFRNRMWRKGTAWTEKETELFYEILRCTGPDFGLMHEFFPTRARNELKSKFNREERTNWERLKEVMSRPALLDDDLYERAAELQREIEEEALAKKMKKETDKGTGMTFKRRKKKQEPDVDEPQEDVSVRSDQSEDLVEEASQIIREMEKEKRKRKGRKRKRIRSDCSESESEGLQSNADEEPPCETESRSKKVKKLSAKAQSLLDKTLKMSKCSEASQENENKDAEKEPHFDGYNEEDDDEGSVITIDTDVIEVSHSSKFFARSRHAPQITRISEPIVGRAATPQSENASTEAATRSVDSTATSPQETTEAVSVEHDCENQDEVVQSDAPESSSAPKKSALTPIPSEVDLSRPRRLLKGRSARKPTVRSVLPKRQPVCIESAKVEKGRIARGSDKESLAENDNPADQPSTSKSPERRTRSTRTAKDLARKSLSVEVEEQQSQEEPAFNESEAANSNNNERDADAGVEDCTATSTSSPAKQKSLEPENVPLKRPQRSKRGFGRKIRGGR